MAKDFDLFFACSWRIHWVDMRGYAEFDGKRFQLTSRVLRLGHAYISSVQLPQIAQPIVEELGHKTDESIAFSVLDGAESLTIASSTPRRIVGIFTRVGTHLPALSTATGRVVLASRSDDEIAKRLRSDGIAVVMLDLTAVGQNLTVEQWYDGLLRMLGPQLGLEVELEEFWQAESRMNPLLRFTTAIQQIVLPKSGRTLVIFVDEIDMVRSLPFSTDEFFAAIRECYNRRPKDSEFERLTFCLLGVATPSDLIRDPRVTPFNIGQRIELSDFNDEEATPLERGLNVERRRGRRLLQRVLFWTNGHPYLTQRLCRAIAEDPAASSVRDVDRFCHELLLSSRARERDDNLLFVRHRLVNSDVSLAALLTLYLQILGQRQPVAEGEKDPAANALRLSGVVRNADGRLQIRNRIYKTVFDREWVLSNLPEQEARRQQLAFSRGSAVALRASAGLVAAALGIGLSFSPLGDLSYDLLLVARPHLPAPEAAVVYLDEKSHMALNQRYNAPWDRALHARLIDRLSAAGARAIVFDIVFSDPNPLDAAADQALAEAIRKSGRVVLAADNVPTGTGEDYMAVPPFDLVRDASVGIGSAEIIPGRDLIVRRHPPNRQLPALSWGTAAFLKAKVTQRRGQENIVRWMNYYGPADYLLAASYAEVIDSDTKALEAFRDKVVFVGARIFTKFSGDRKDEYRTPHSFWISDHPFISGVEIQATACLNLLRGDWLIRLSPAIEAGVLLLAGLMLGYGLPLFRPMPATLLALAAALFVVGLSFLCFWQLRIWFPWLLIVAIEIPVAWVSLMMINLTKLHLVKASGRASRDRSRRGDCPPNPPSGPPGNRPPAGRRFRRARDWWNRWSRFGGRQQHCPRPNPGQ
jgi:CHASE2 domain-containing sensor protein